MATLIGELYCVVLGEEERNRLIRSLFAGLSLRVRLLRSLPERFKVDIKVKEGTHQSENAGELTGSEGL